jgi:DNA-binding GntR family transcriptional regulator
MMSSGPVAERIYLALKRRIFEGNYLPGERIDPNALATELSASVSPVRDVLHRLEGERLIETNVRAGFRTPLWTEPDLRDAYSWSADLLTLVIGSSKHESILAQCADMDLAAGNVAEATAELFGRISHASGNIEHRRAVASLNERLHNVRLAEAVAIPNSGEELDTLFRVAQNGTIPALRRAVMQYHRVRHREVPMIMRTLHRHDR